MVSQSDEVIQLLAQLRVSQGARTGEFLKILPWQKKLIRGIIGARTSAVSVGRGNGKTSLCAGLAIASLIGPLRQRRGETIVAASSFSQAKITFEHITAFLRPLLNKHRRRFRISDSANSAGLEDRESGCRVRCIGSDPRRAHGLAPILVLADEPSQWLPTQAEAMLAALKTASGKIPGSRFVALGTRPADPGHWFAKMLDGGAGYSQCHAARPDDPPFQRATWRRANPSLDWMPDLEAAIRDEAKLARIDPAMLAASRALRLNLGTSDVEIQVLLDAALWGSLEHVAARQGPLVWGIDLGTSQAQSAIAAFWPQTGALSCLAAFPEQPSLEERGLRDGVGRLYRDCADRGELLTLGQRATDVGALLRAGMERFGKPDLVVSDRWREAELRDALDKAGVPPAALEVRGMGYRDGAEDVRQFRRACAGGRVAPSPSLLLRSAMAEARTMSDPAGNQKLCKGSEGGRRMRAKDDASAAAILAVSAGVRTGLHLAPRGGVYLGMI